MLEIQRISDAMHRKIGIVLLAALIWLISLPMASVQAGGYYSEKAHKVEVSKPYYSTKERRRSQNEHSQPYYVTNNHQKQQTNVAETDENYIENEKRTAEGIPQNLRSRSRQKTEERRVRQNEPFKPYYSSKERRIAQADSFKPYYSSKNRQKQKANRLEIGDDYIDSGRRATEVNPNDFRNDSRQYKP